MDAPGNTAGESRWALGLMSGTALDGVDAALIETDGACVTAFGPALTLDYPEAVRACLRACLDDPEHGPLDEAARVLTEHHVHAVKRVLDKTDVRPAVIGFHGQTVLHRPEAGLTRQIGDAALLARRTGVPVVFDLRQADVAAGGQGAPLASAYHAALAAALPRPLAVVNIGGVANVTWIGEDGYLLAFDTGPGNAPLDDWMRRHTGRAMDVQGRTARAGRVDEPRLARALGHPYFGRSPPKSLDREDFTHVLAEGLSCPDGAATLTAFTAAAIARARDWMPKPPRRWLITGGGRRNPTLMEALAMRLDAPVDAVESAGWDGDALEAQAFAYLAVRSLRALPLTFPGTTGVKRPLTGGRLFRP